MKPKLTYAEFVAAKKDTVSSIIRRFIWDSEQPGAKPLGVSHRYTLLRLIRSPIGSIKLDELKAQDILDHCRMRKADGILPQTTNQDCTYLTVALKYAGSAWDDCEGISDKAVKDAKPFLAKHGMISKSLPRDRRPTQEEINLLFAYFQTPAGRGKARMIDMATLTLWQVASGRRIGESCKLLWEDWNRENHTILVRKMKDPRNKNKQKVVALPPEAQTMLEALWEKRTTARIFPYNSKSVGASYTLAKKVLAKRHPGLFLNLRLHDSRRECATRLIEKGYTTTQAILVTGHETDHMLQRTYMRQKPENFKNGPLAGRADSRTHSAAVAVEAISTKEGKSHAEIH